MSTAGIVHTNAPWKSEIAMRLNHASDWYYRRAGSLNWVRASGFLFIPYAGQFVVTFIDPNYVDPTAVAAGIGVFALAFLLIDHFCIRPEIVNLAHRSSVARSRFELEVFGVVPIAPFEEPRDFYPGLANIPAPTESETTRYENYYDAKYVNRQSGDEAYLQAVVADIHYDRRLRELWNRILLTAVLLLLAPWIAWVLVRDFNIRNSIVLLSTSVMPAFWLLNLIDQNKSAVSLTNLADATHLKAKDTKNTNTIVELAQSIASILYIRRSTFTRAPYFIYIFHRQKLSYERVNAQEEFNKSMHW
jgi:hypothetical protein